MLLHTVKNRLFCIRCFTSRPYVSPDAQPFTKTHLCTPENIAKCLAALKSARQIKLSEEPSRRTSAVLIPICVHRTTGELSLLYTQRSSKIKRHIGEVSFPGGIREDTDESYEACALRETSEEIGISQANVAIWGTSNLIVPRLGPSIMPVVGMIDNYDASMLRLNLDEVEKVFTVPLAKLCSDECRRHTQFRRTYSLPVYVNVDERIWGITSVITHLFLSAFLPKQCYRQKLAYVSSYKI